MSKRRTIEQDPAPELDRAAETEPAPPGTSPPSQGGYGHKVSRSGSTRPQGGANPVGPESTDSAGRKGRTR
jgi:hypothetical protein